MSRQLKTTKNQKGAVLLVSLLMLLVTTFVGFSAMETSNLESKMAAARELKELTFQSAEAVVEFGLTDVSYASAAYTVALQSSTSWPTRSYGSSDFPHDTYISGSSTMSFDVTANSLGYSIRKGASGIATYYYEVEATALRANTNASSTHIQGVFVEGPSLN
jgi:type IV pilus assembly protein PilX